MSSLVKQKQLHLSVTIKQKQLHSTVEKLDTQADEAVGANLVNMFAKCRSLRMQEPQDASIVFFRMSFIRGSCGWQTREPVSKSAEVGLPEWSLRDPVKNVAIRNVFIAGSARQEGMGMGP